MKQEDYNRINMDEIYRNISPENIPWNIETPPKKLVEIVESKLITPCRTLDVGCGAGNYAIYFASQGFDVTGVDISPTAIRLAKENAAKRGIKCDFIVADAISDLSRVKGTFDFIYDWEFLHQIHPEQRETYVKNVYRLLNPHARYLSVCFNEKDPAFGGNGKFRKTPLGTILYFSSLQELGILFSEYFILRELSTIEVEGKLMSHLANYALLEKRD